MGGVGDLVEWTVAVWRELQAFLNWIGIHPSIQDLTKATLLILFVLAILMVLGDVYRGEIQNTLHRIRLVPNPTRDATYKTALRVPRYVVQPTLDGVHSNAHFYYRYRDFRGRLKTRPLRTYRVRLRVRQALSNAAAPGHEVFHRYSTEELSRLVNRTEFAGGSLS